MTLFRHHFNIKRITALGYQCVNGCHQRSQMDACYSSLGFTQLAVKVPKIDIFRQGFGAFTFDVLANVVLAGIEQAVTVFACNIERVSFFQTELW